MKCDRSNFALICSFTNVLIGTTLFSSVVKAQTIPDDTLGEESSVVTPLQLRNLIEAGAIRGENLFHSFSEFSIPEGQQVYFANPDNITNILTRVTGNNVSEIFGTLGVDGAANLFLLNPNGIVFGENASLDVAGSFTATTAESLIFDDREFSAINPDAPPLLTVNINPGLQYGNINPNSEISNQGVLAVGNGQNLSLVGGKVTQAGSLIVPNGFTEISGAEIDFTGDVDTRSPDGNVGTFLLDSNNISIGSAETISGESISQALANSNVVLQADNDITVDDNITSLTDNNLTFQAGRSLSISDNYTIFLTGGDFTTQFSDAALGSNGNTEIASFTMNPTSAIITNGGDVTVQAGISNNSQINMAADSTIITGNPNENGGDITLSASGDITTGFLVSGFINNPGVALQVSDFVPINTLPGTDKAGDINVISSNGAISSTNFVLANALGEGGNITFNAAGNLTFTAPGELSRIGNLSSVGMLAGEINLTSSETLLFDDVRILNRIGGDGEPKNITLTGKSILVESSSIITLTRDETQSELGEIQNARGGDVIVQATDDVIVRNGNISTRADFGTADAGDLILNARSVKVIKNEELPEFLEDFSSISTTAGDNTSGDGGDLTINASESVEVIGDRPGVFVANSPEDLVVLEGALIATSTQESGTSGDLTINTPRLLVRDRATVTTFPFVGEGGNLTINAEEIFLQGKASISTGTLGQDAGDLKLESEHLTLRDGGRVGTTTFGRGDAGNFNLKVNELSIGANSSIGTNSFGAGDGGILSIESDLIEIIGTSTNSLISNGINATSFGTGNAGDIEIKSDRITLSQGGEITTATINGGSGGNIDLDTGTLQLNNGRINASTVTASPGGNITIRATDFVDVEGAGFNALLENIVNPSFTGAIGFENFTQGIYTISAGEGTAGNVSIETPNFSLSNGGLISTTTLGAGSGGNITVDASNTIDLENSLLATGTFTDAASGDINLNARQLNATGGAQAITTTFGAGTAGNLTVNVTEEINLIDPTETGIASGLFASSYLTASGTGGDITITTGELNITDGAAVSVSGEGEGNAGDINIAAASIFLDNGSIIAQSNSGEGGNITLQIADNLILNNNSQISTRAGTETTGGGDGGNINITADFIITAPTENSDITANAFAGDGGNINITTQQLFGLEFRPELTQFSDITASSEFGIDGNIEIEILEFDPTNSLVKLPETLNDSSNQIVVGCPADTGANFTVTGRGGLPYNPRQEVAEEIILQAFETGTSRGEWHSPITKNTQPSIVEAQGWIVNERGKVELVASSMNNVNIRQESLNCDR
ncbi:filamentous hemagglutinin N-terminal domain-containing protein [Pleurocapsa sp. PCC 7319]|uniref:two-partner secretion domain-containing protein n=1 Tax=Pleurocapsa sp. PCC 7319 TaxID=118161 RepID=UPI000347880A|nr:filamentous hemagglutinin N-terminal domain-containing protein [Pleurocapsa sp. PCC 7319]